MESKYDPKKQSLSEELRQSILNFFQIPENIEQNFKVKLNLEELVSGISKQEKAMMDQVKTNDKLRKAKLSN